MTRLEQLRLDAHLTARELGERAGISPRTIRRLESGHAAHVSTLARLSTYFAVPASELLRPAPDRFEAAA